MIVVATSSEIDQSFKIPKGVKTFQLDRITDLPWKPELVTWKHENMKVYFYTSTNITQYHIDSTSVAYKQSEEEDI